MTNNKTEFIDQVECYLLQRYGFELAMILQTVFKFKVRILVTKKVILEPIFEPKVKRILNSLLQKYFSASVLLILIYKFKGSRVYYHFLQFICKSNTYIQNEATEPDIPHAW